MNPEEFENLVAEHYQTLGFATETTPTTSDFGVDIFATKTNEKIAIQVKMYDSRTVNYKDVMYLFAASKLFSCSRSIMVSSGEVRTDAKEVADKLNVEIVEYFGSRRTTQLASKSPKLIPQISTNDHSKFSRIWKDYIVPLQGQEVRTVTGKSNIIKTVNWDGITRISSNGRPSPIGIEIFEWSYEQLLRRGELTRDEINQHYTNRGSAIIFAVLATLPFVDVTLKPATLHYLGN